MPKPVRKGPKRVERAAPIPDSAFQDFYKRTVLARLRAGRPHATLGRNLARGRFGEVGRDTLERLCELGLAKEDVVVDYGCGTLREGVHLIRHLDAGHYWGLDISEELLAIGRELVGESLLDAKQPRLHAIDDAVIAEAAAARPRFVISSAVMIHVPPGLLNDYLGSLRALLGTGARAVLRAYVADRTIQISRQTWAHGLSVIETTAERHELACEVLKSVPAEGKRPEIRQTTLVLRRA